MDGYLGKILNVDLTNGEIAEVTLNPDYARMFIGGSGLAARYIYDLADADTDPLGPENPLVFMTGPLVGTRAPSCGRYVICARSPQTNLWGESNVGGFLGPHLRFAGYDGMIVRGQASQPVYLLVRDGEAELREASHLWGMDCYQTQETIKEDLGDPSVRVACIGPGGERLVKYASVIAGKGRAAGRSGMGAVMGSKRLKAVACRGTGSVPLADRDAFDEIARETLAWVKDDVSTQVFNQTGTAGSANLCSMLGNMPNKYFTQGTFDAVDNISGSTMAETILVGTSGCFGCVVQCGREVEITEGPYQLERTDGPEYETVGALGSMLLIDDLAAVCYMSHLCNRYGLDTMSTGVTLGLAHYLYEEGVIESEDLGGLALGWGDPEPAIKLIEMIANREGLGDLLAEGTLAVARHYGTEEMAAQVQGLEVAMHDPRASSGVALSYLTSPRGACHNKSDAYLLDIGRTMEDIGIGLVDRFEEEGKAALMVRHQNWRSAGDALIACMIVNFPVDGLVEMLGAATGWDIALDSLLRAGERILNLKRVLNLRWGLKTEDEKLPGMLLKPLEEGGTGGYVPDVERLLTDYYEVRKWDRKSGKPTLEKLRELDLADVAEELY
ncbi:MAG: aldehyde ferredoxin oxidoreductase [Chloroflexi bacterium B3_Chlor]|nr:MAG: aldehyde ferredoxin oxidoreductase [Chloroflexi bacterium B3_Chlor]